MSAYVIAQLTVIDPDGFEDYRRAVRPVVEAHGGRFLVQGGEVSRLEGEPGGPRVIVLEFPDKTAAAGFYNSPEYQRILPMRLNTATGPVIVVEDSV